MIGSILVVDDDARFGRSLARTLAGDGHRVDVFDHSRRALEQLERRAYDLLFADLVMPDMDGIQLLGRVKLVRPSCEVVVMTGHASIETVQAALRGGARDYVTKPVALADVRPLIRDVLGAQNDVVSDDTGPVDLRGAFDGVVSRSGPMAPVFQVLPRIARAAQPVLISGESGTGKEVVAQALQRLSPRRDGPFVQVNCAALPDSLLEAELFGAVRGAYTGCVRDRRGYFELADGGTLFLDEIGETSPNMQAKLLRVVQTGVFNRVGDPERALVSDVRIIAATNRDLEESVEQGRFRKDLFYRLHVLPIALPPLRDRLDELSSLIDFSARAAGFDRRVRVDPAAMQAMVRHPWPGNIRELRNAVEHALVLGGGDEICFEHLPGAIRDKPIEEAAAPVPLESLDESEARHIREALRQTGFNRTRAAELLGITRRTLGYRMTKHRLMDDRTGDGEPRQRELPGIRDGRGSLPESP